MEMASYFIEKQKSKFKFSPMEHLRETLSPWMNRAYSPTYDQEVMLHGVNNSDVNLAFNLTNVNIERAIPGYAQWDQYSSAIRTYPDAPESKDIKLTCPYNVIIHEQLARAMDGGLFLVLSRDQHIQNIVNEHTWFMYSLDAGEREITIELKSREIRQSGSIQRRESRELIYEEPWLR